ncbi:MAG: PAS domain-containing protein [Gemmatimonadaceae bacterium]|nr:PAS domain-containing protein [Gemmatimonadaceae bacterium]
MLTPSTGIPALSDADKDAVGRDGPDKSLVASMTNDVVWDWNLIADKLEFSPAVRVVFAYGPDEPVDDIEWWTSHIHSEERESVVKGIRQAIAGRGQFWSAEYRFRRGDDTYAHVFDRGFISRDNAGNAVRMMGTMVDVTDRKLAEQALRDSERRFRSLIENASDAIGIIDAQGRFSYASESYVNVLGFTPAELLGKPVLDYVHEDDLANATSTLERMTTEPGANLHMQLRCRHKDGTWRVLSSRARNLMHDPAIRGVVAASRDVTQQAVLEAELVQAQKMEAMGQLAGGVAHDFNNLLTVITTNVDLIGSAITPNSEAHENLTEIRHAAAQATGLTRQLLNFTQRRSEDPQVLNLNEVVTDSQALLQRVIGEHAELRVKLSPRAPLVKIDRAQLEQVLMNLVFNARDALVDGGTVEVVTERQRVQPGESPATATVPPGEYSVLIVRDTGMGMTPETMARAFDPFYTTKEIGKGTGLGLAMVYTIVKRAGGAIDLETKRGAGTTFCIYFPRVLLPSLTPMDGTPIVRPKQGSETVLLVEDEDMVRKVVRRTLTGRGYKVVEASNGKEALALALEDPSRISLVLTDVMMPQMGGPELARRLWAQFPQLKVIFVSGYAPDTMSPESALPPGAILIEKPFAIEKLITKVREVIDGDTAGTAHAIDMSAKTN